MNDKNSNEIDIQRNYYKKTADQYEKIHVADESGEHFFALSCLAGLTNYLERVTAADPPRTRHLALRAFSHRLIPKYEEYFDPEEYVIETVNKMLEDQENKNKF